MAQDTAVIQAGNAGEIGAEAVQICRLKAPPQLAYAPGELRCGLRLRAGQVVDAGARVTIHVAKGFFLFQQGLEQHAQAQVFVDVGKIAGMVFVLVTQHGCIALS